MTALIRRLTPADAHIAQRIVARFHRGDVPVAYLGRYLANPTNYLFVAELDGAVVGFLTAHRLDRLNREATQFFIYEIEVDEEFRRQGIGSGLLRAVLESARIEGAEVFVLTNESNRPAVRFYESLGGMVETGDDLLFVYRPWSPLPDSPT